MMARDTQVSRGVDGQRQRVGEPALTDDLEAYQSSRTTEKT